jgi:AhpD family alkylhydroperoxidase
MGKNWLDMITELSAEVKVLRAGAPDVMKEFSAMARAASGPEALDTKTKELIALAIAVAVRCDPCIAFHAQAAVKQGASRDEVMEAMGMAIYMGAGPSVMYASQAIEAYDQFKSQANASGV